MRKRVWASCNRLNNLIDYYIQARVSQNIRRDLPIAIVIKLSFSIFSTITFLFVDPRVGLMLFFFALFRLYNSEAVQWMRRKAEIFLYFFSLKKKNFFKTKFKGCKKVNVCFELCIYWNNLRIILIVFYLLNLWD